MRWLDALRTRLRLILSRRSAESRMDEEFRLHIEMETESNARAGMSLDEARRRALLAFGGVERHKERLRDERGVRWLEDLLADLRYAARWLRRSPGFATVAILTLGLGIGASSAIFSVAYGILYRSLPYDRPEQLVRVYTTNRDGERSGSVSPPNFMSIREQSRSFAEVAVADNEDVILTGHGESRWFEGAEVSAGFFEVMGTKPIFGRTFLEGENLPGADGVAVISHSLWHDLTGGRADIVGQTLMLHARPRVVVGVMPAGFDFPFDSDVWIPLEYGETYSAASAGRGGFSGEYAVARLRDGATLEAARSDLAMLADRLERQFPEGNRNTGFTISPLRDALFGSARAALLLLLASVGLLLLIACANVAGLFLARAASRQEELAVRVAIGAGRSRLVRQLMTESFLVSSLGGSLGLLLTTWGTRLIIATTPELPRIDAIRVDGAVFGFGLGVTLLAVVLTGLVPAWQATRTAAASRLREGGRGAVTRSGARMRAGLVTAEIALAVILLAAAGLLMKSFARLASADPGFRTEGAVAFMVRLPDSYDTDGKTLSYYDELFQHLRALPGVDGAGAVHRLPMAWNGFSARLIRVEGIEPPSPGRPGQAPRMIYRPVTPGYFDAMSIPIVRGRDISESDRAGAPLVAVINETAAQRFFQGEDPLGRRMSITAGDDDDLLWTVVGIAGDVVDQRFGDVQEPEIFLPYAQATWSSYMSVVVRCSGDPRALVPAIRRAALQVDPNAPARDFRTLERVVGDAVAGERILSSFLGIFAAAALLLAAIGVFGLFSFTVAERTREIAVRAALGARRAELMTMVLGDAIRLTGVGLTLGVLGAVASTRVLEGQLYGVKALDPATFAGAIVLLALTAVSACLLPARRAAAVDPITALRQD